MPRLTMRFVESLTFDQEEGQNPYTIVMIRSRDSGSWCGKDQ